MTSKKIKEIMFSLGADLCGIANIERFYAAPEGFHPLDVLPCCKSVISFACRFPSGSLSCKNAIPYTLIRNTITSKVDAIALNFCIEMEKYRILSIPIPANDSISDPKTGRNRSIISQKHAAQAAGLGSIGRHSLLITPEFGSMIWLGCVLTDLELKQDELKENICDNCNLCVKACPVNALENVEMDQEVCWDYAFGDNLETGEWEISCHKCRDICPYNLGINNKIFDRQKNDTKESL